MFDPDPSPRTNFGPLGSGQGRKPPMVVADDGYQLDAKHFVIPKHYDGSIATVMLTRGMIEDRIEKLAMDIRKHYGMEQIHILCILKGSRGFFSKLLEILDRIHKYQVNCYAAGVEAQAGFSKAPYMEHYIRLKSYEGTESTGGLKVIGDSLEDLKGKDVLIVEDIIDTGNTLSKFCNILNESKPKSVRVASLLEKRTTKSNGFKGDFVGFDIPDEFIVGYCLDYNEHFRDLDHVCVMAEAGIKKYAD